MSNQDHEETNSVHDSNEDLGPLDTSHLDSASDSNITTQFGENLERSDDDSEASNVIEDAQDDIDEQCAF
jgi:hypothetical protein